MSIFFYVYATYLVVYFPRVFLRTVFADGLRASAAHKAIPISSNELHRIFDALDRISPDLPGLCEIETLLELLIHIRPRLAKHRVRVKTVVTSLFPEDKAFGFP